MCSMEHILGLKLNSLLRDNILQGHTIAHKEVHIFTHSTNIDLFQMWRGMSHDSDKAFVFKGHLLLKEKDRMTLAGRSYHHD